jgi:hypothetical protein
MMQDQQFTATKDDHVLTWANGSLEGDEDLIRTVQAAFMGDTTEWLPYGYQASAESPHAVALALRRFVPGVTIEEDPPLEWDDEIMGEMPPDEITPEELGIDENGVELAEWQESKHPRDKSGRFASTASQKAAEAEHLPKLEAMLAPFAEGKPSRASYDTPPSGYEDLRKMAAPAQNEFENALRNVVGPAVGAQETKPMAGYDPEQHGNADRYFEASMVKAAQAGGAHYVIAPMKSEKSAASKANRFPHEDGSTNWGAVDDMVRGTIAADTIQGATEMASQVLEALTAEGWTMAAAPKNRFSSPYQGYRDLKLSLKSPSGAIAELQIHVNDILIAKNGPGHALYESTRELQPKVEREEASSEEKAKYRALTRQSERLYTSAWRDSLGVK